MQMLSAFVEGIVDSEADQVPKVLKEPVERYEQQIKYIGLIK